MASQGPKKCPSLGGMDYWLTLKGEILEILPNSTVHVERRRRTQRVLMVGAPKEPDIEDWVEVRKIVSRIDPELRVELFRKVRWLTNIFK